VDKPFILITGALTGIGRATAIAFAKKGAKRPRETGREPLAQPSCAGADATFPGCGPRIDRRSG
jgi:NAD(P)-dependent dehydrogenase (short-subunit alcohol dehydrogenase family)